MDNKYEVVVVIVNHGYSEEVIESAKEAGAKGGTVMDARGSGFKETGNFFGITIEPEKEVILIVLEETTKEKIMKAICKKAGINTKGRGIVFSLPITDIVGLVEEEQL